MPVDSAQMAAERWFLDHGLPSVVTRRARARQVWPRCAPAMGAWAVLMLILLVIFALTGVVEIKIEGTPTTAEWVVLALLTLSLPLAALGGWLISRITGAGMRSVISTAGALLGLLDSVLERDGMVLILTVVYTAVVVLFTATGIGSVLGWAARHTVSQLAAAGELLIGALPVVLLTVLMFFNTYAWLMAAAVSRGRLWLAIAFLVLIAWVFVVSGLLERAGPALDRATASPGHAEQLTGTPFEHMPDPPNAADPLTRAERFNAIVVLAISQIAQILMVAIVTAGIFFVLGLILLNPKLLDLWTHEVKTDGTFLGMTIPVPDSLIQMTLFLAAITFMYIGARAVGGGEYRSRFLDPLIENLESTLLARNRYRGQTRLE